MFSAGTWTKEIQMGLVNANRHIKPSTVSEVDVSDNSLAFLQNKDADVHGPITECEP